jgi:hypothetical protein
MNFAKKCVSFLQTRGTLHYFYRTSWNIKRSRRLYGISLIGKVEEVVLKLGEILRRPFVLSIRKGLHKFYKNLVATSEF